ncbi:MAG: hypothetical protein R3C15_15170 [Thermoleophilia bacterium]
MAGPSRRAHDVAVVRLNPDGSLDPSFAGEGSLTLDLGVADVANDAALLPSGKIVLAATSQDAQLTGQMALVQVTTDGLVDTSFDFDGLKKVQFGDTQFARAVAVQPDGAIVLAGWTGEGRRGRSPWRARSASPRPRVLRRLRARRPPRRPCLPPRRPPGGPGADRLDGGAGADALRGGRGRDVCAGGKGKDIGLGCEAGAL